MKLGVREADLFPLPGLLLDAVHMRSLPSRGAESPSDQDMDASNLPDLAR